MSFNAHHLRMIASSRKKTDKRAAYWIAKCLQTGMTPRCRGGWCLHSMARLASVYFARRAALDRTAHQTKRSLQFGSRSKSLSYMSCLFEKSARGDLDELRAVFRKQRGRLNFIEFRETEAYALHVEARIHAARSLGISAPEEADEANDALIVMRSDRGGTFSKNGPTSIPNNLGTSHMNEEDRWGMER